MNLTLQWLIVALIGIGAVWMLARHFGLLPRKRKHSAGCPGCDGCAPKTPAPR
jgi:hypothetical protein